MPAALLLSMPLHLTSSPQAISHGFPSVHDVHASASLPPNGALPKLFPTVSHPSTLSLPFSGAPPSYIPVLDPQFFRAMALMEIVPENPCHQLCMFASLPPSGDPPKLFPRFTIHACSSGVPASLPPAEVPRGYFHASQSIHASPALPSLRQSSPQSISTLHSPSTLNRRSGLAPSGTTPPKFFPCFTLHPRWSGAPSNFHASQSIHARPALPPCSLQRSSPQAISTLHIIHARPALPSCSLQRSSPQPISTLHSPSALVRRSRLTPSSGAPPKLFPRFALHVRRSTLHSPSRLVRRSRLAPSP